ncbi:hypothetical protein GCM10027426_22630 [Microbacterium lacusdiani]
MRVRHEQLVQEAPDAARVSVAVAVVAVVVVAVIVRVGVLVGVRGHGVAASARSWCGVPSACSAWKIASVTSFAACSSTRR